jgi:iron complex outermembrane receptor protein
MSGSSGTTMRYVNRLRGLGCLCLLFCLPAVSPAWASNKPSLSENELLDLSIEELMNVEVTTVSRKEEKLFNTPAAVYVITQEDIRRSGATSIPEALRMAPGVQVSRINSNSWAITSRGFQNQFANKLLVLIDGRSVYNSEYSGVFWDVQDVMLEDVERIEVIRGPGGTLWGANAVNGVINVITKKAQDTQGTLLTGGAGNEEKDFGAVRYGGKIGATGYYRVYGKYFDRDGTSGNSAGFPSPPHPPGGDLPAPGGGTPDTGATDDWDMSRSGFRTDWETPDDDKLTFQGDLYYGEVGMTASRMSFPVSFDQEPADITQDSGGNLLGRWTRTLSETSDVSLQLYYDKVRRMESNFKQVDDSYDADFQHRFALDARQEIVWGLGYRFNTNSLKSRSPVTFDPETRRTDTPSSFIQDEIHLIPDLLALTLGSKFEHNDYTGFEYQPSARLQWTPDERHAVWGAISRAVRTPSRTNNDIRVNMREQGILGNDDFVSERLIAYELGYRVTPSRSLSLDFATFYNVYDELATIEWLEAPGDLPPGHNRLDVYDNKMSGETYGGEVAAHWSVTDNWRLSPGYTFTQMQLHIDRSSTDNRSDRDEENSPHNQFQLRSYLDLPHDLEFDASLYYVDALRGVDIPAYFQLDLRLAWFVAKGMELALVGQNLLDSRHPEFSSFTGGPQTSYEIQRGAYVKLTYRF